MRALVLDPSTNDCILLESYLRERGYHTVPVASVHQAREAFERDSFDVVVLELALPDGSGLIMCNEVRERLGEKLMIIITGKHVLPKLKATAFQLGADVVVEKPCDGDEFIARVDAFQRRQQRYAIGVGTANTRPERTSSGALDAASNAQLVERCFADR